MDQLRHGVLVLAAFLATSCQLLFPPPMTITGSGPTAGRYGSTAGLVVWVAFSHSLSHGNAEKGILLKENGATMDVQYSWSGNKVTLTPTRGLSVGSRYDLTVASTVEDDQGADLGANFTLTFYTRLDDIRPMAFIPFPANGTSSTNLFQPVLIAFSKPVDRASFYNSLTITPAFAKASYVWGTGDASCVVTPLVALTTPAVYTVKVGSALTDTEGNSMGTDVSGWFAEGNAGAGPLIGSVQNTTLTNAAAGTYTPGALTLTPVANPSGSVSFDAGFDRTWGLQINFSTPVLRSGLDSLISIEPAWSYSVPYSTASSASVQLIPQAALTYGTIYTLTVHKGVTDVSGNVSTTDSVYRFKVDASASSPPVLKSITFNTNSTPAANVILGDHSTDYQTLTTTAFSNVASSTYVDLAFNVASGANIDAASLMAHFSITATDPNTTAAITAVGSPSPLGSSPQTIRVTFLFTRGGSGLLIFKLSAGFADSLGNATTADQTWPVLE